MLYDRDYNNYQLFADWMGACVYFIIHTKDNVRFEMVDKHAVLQHRHIVKDQTIHLTRLARLIHEHFCYKHRYVTATSMASPAR